MIIDAHTHIFPRSFIDDRGRLLCEEPVFAELYAAPESRMATDADLLTAMDEAGVDRAIIAGFAWSDVGRCVAHNDALLDAAARSDGRLIPLCCVPLGDVAVVRREMTRCMAAGAVGFGELRLTTFSDQEAGWDALSAIGEMSTALGAVVLLHASEPVGHTYPGKDGGPLSAIWRFVTEHPDLTVVLGHLGGGLPFYAHMPEVRAVFDRVFVDTAAAPWLYESPAIRTTIDLIGAERLLFGSDFPLRHPRRDLAWMRSAHLSEAELTAVLGGNAASLFD